MLKLLFAIVFSIFSWTASASSASIQVTYSAISGAMAPLWVAQDGDYFRREGLETQLLYIGGGSLLIQSMLGGDVQFAFGPSVPVVNASLRGADLVLIANTGNAMVFSIMSRPEIKNPPDLKGKKVGVTRLGGSTDLALDFALERWGSSAGTRRDGASNRRHAGEPGGTQLRRVGRGGFVFAEQLPREEIRPL